MITEINTILQKIKDQDKVLNRIVEILDHQKEEVLTSDQVCRMMDIGRTHLLNLDKLGITEPIFLEEDSKKKYYLRSQIIKIFTDKIHRKRWKN